MKLFAVVVTYNRVSELKNTLLHIQEQGIAPSSILVINNNSTDDTRLVLGNEFPSVQTFHLSENIASAGGFALGMQESVKQGADWVWLFNDDSRPLSGALQAAAPHFSGAVGKPLGLLKIGERSGEGISTLLNWKGVRVPVTVPISNDLTDTDLITFDGCFISRKLIETIGVCDPLFFMGTYEFDYCLRAHDAGFRICTLPNGLLADSKLGSAKGTPPWRQYYNTRNHLWLGIHRRSFEIIKAWFIRESKYTIAIILKGDQKWQRLLYKYRAIRDALLNRRGKRYHPDLN